VAGCLKQVMKGSNGKTRRLRRLSTLKWALFATTTGLAVVFCGGKGRKVSPVGVIEAAVMEDAPQDREPLAVGALILTEGVVTAYGSEGIVSLPFGKAGSKLPLKLSPMVCHDLWGEVSFQTVRPSLIRGIDGVRGFLFHHHNPQIIILLVLNMQRVPPAEPHDQVTSDTQSWLCHFKRPSTAITCVPGFDPPTCAPPDARQEGTSNGVSRNAAFQRGDVTQACTKGAPRRLDTGMAKPLVMGADELINGSLHRQTTGVRSRGEGTGGGG